MPATSCGDSNLWLCDFGMARMHLPPSPSLQSPCLDLCLGLLSHTAQQMPASACLCEAISGLFASKHLFPESRHAREYPSLHHLIGNSSYICQFVPVSGHQCTWSKEHTASHQILETSCPMSQDRLIPCKGKSRSLAT